MDGNDGSGACHPAMGGKPRRVGLQTYATHHLHIFALGVLLLSILVLTSCQGSQYAGSWLTFGDDPDASQGLTQSYTLGIDPPQSAALSMATVSKLHQGWRVTLPDLADVRPILVRNMSWPDGTTRDVLYLTTNNGMLLALDASTGAKLWAVPPKNTNNPKFTKSSPAADPLTGLIYSYSLDGKVHRYLLTTGQEVVGNGWPELVTRMPESEKVSSSLNLVHGYLYVTTASFGGDAPPYQGHMVAINVTTGAKHVFNSICSNLTHLLAPGECHQNGGGIWARPGVVVDPVTGNIFFTTANDYFTANKGGTDWGQTVVEMTADGSKVVDSYTPANYKALEGQDLDLGSVAPVLLPTIPQSRTPELAVQGGKEGLLRLLNRENLSGQGGPAHVGGELQTIRVPNGCPIEAQPMAWTDPSTGALWLFAANLCGLDGYQVQTSSAGMTSLHLAWSAPAVASSPVISGGVLFAATSQALLAFDPNSGHERWSSAWASARGDIGYIHWESPIVVDGRVYCPDEGNRLMMYQL
jgi:outer membrane protein assembly factor BamB